MAELVAEIAAASEDLSAQSLTIYGTVWSLSGLVHGGRLQQNTAAAGESPSKKRAYKLLRQELKKPKAVKPAPANKQAGQAIHI